MRMVAKPLSLTDRVIRTLDCPRQPQVDLELAVERLAILCHFPLGWARPLVMVAFLETNLLHFSPANLPFPT
jgi:hypothetical protein